MLWNPAVPIQRPFFHVKKRTLIAVAGCVWLAAGVNVARLGALSYQKLAAVTAIHVLLCAAVFCLFGAMFFKMSQKHVRRICSYADDFRPIWRFFDLKAYLIMAVMMGGGSVCALQGCCRMCLLRCFIQALAAHWHWPVCASAPRFFGIPKTDRVIAAASVHLSFSAAYGYVNLKAYRRLYA